MDHLVSPTVQDPRPIRATAPPTPATGRRPGVEPPTELLPNPPIDNRRANITLIQFPPVAEVSTKLIGRLGRMDLLTPAIPEFLLGEQILMYFDALKFDVNTRLSINDSIFATLVLFFKSFNYRNKRIFPRFKSTNLAKS